MTNSKEPAIEVVSKDVSEQLDQCERTIRIAIAGQQKGAAEQFLYALIAGRALLQAKAILPHGNSDPNAGIKKWAEATFPKVVYRTHARYMEFSQLFDARLAQLPKSARKRPLQLTNGEPDEKDRGMILRLMPKVMDGKSMTGFMRDCRLLADPQKPKHHDRKPVSKQEENKAKIEQAKRVWKAIRADLETGLKVLKRLDASVMQQNLDALIEAGNKHRAALKRLGAEQKEGK
jgi:hypothetical protein